MNIRRIGFTSIIILAGLVVPLATATAAEAPGHIVLKGGKLAVYTSGKIGSPVTLGRYRVTNKGEDWNGDHFANAYGAGSFFWAPGGKQTNDFLKVTTTGATLVTGAPNSTIFAPVASGKYTVLALLGSKGPSKDVLTDCHGKLVIAKEGAHGPSGDQLWALR
jgi:hypothetical protein